MPDESLQQSCLGRLGQESTGPDFMAFTVSNIPVTVIKMMGIRIPA